MGMMSIVVVGSLVSLVDYIKIPGVMPHAGSGVGRIDPLSFLAGCCKRRLNQA